MWHNPGIHDRNTKTQSIQCVANSLSLAIVIQFKSSNLYTMWYLDTVCKNYPQLFDIIAIIHSANQINLLTSNYFRILAAIFNV